MREESPSRKIIYPRWWNFVLFLLFVCALVASNWAAVNTINYEVGDLAANSLLIQDAKSLRLLTGHYSRLGFNHPGPAILYVLASGELVFYDWLNIVKSPFSGQLVAVAFYNAIWMVLLFRLIYKTTKSIPSSVLAISVFFVAAALFDYQFFAGIWFPHMYFFPFSVLIISSSRLANGNSDSFQSLALSAGFLINGHASFVAIIGIIFLIVLVFNHQIFKTNKHNRYLFSKSYFKENKNSIFTFSLTLFLFFVPLLLETVNNYPGPIASYADYSGEHEANTILEAIGFIGAYWGGIAPLFLGILVMCLIFSPKFESSEFAKDAISMLMVFFAATFALLLYAMYGADLLDQKYIGLFYHSIPALTISLTFMCVYQMINISQKKNLALGLSCLCLLGVYVQINKAPTYTLQYNQPGIVDLYDSLSALNSEGRLVLDLDNTNDWQFVWYNIAGLQVYSKRNKKELLCINKNWHILFTKPSICTPDEILTGRRFIVRKTAKNDSPRVPPAIESQGLSFYESSTFQVEPITPSISDEDS